MHKTLTRYQRIAAEGGWPSIERNRPLEPGDTGAAVEQLRDRLAATGDLPADQVDGTTYSKAVVEAVRRFEERHGLPTDGAVGADDIEVLNVPASQQARKLALNVERYRWMPRNLGVEHVFVNLMNCRLTASRDGEEVRGAGTGDRRLCRYAAIRRVGTLLDSTVVHTVGMGISASPSRWTFAFFCSKGTG